MNEIHAVILLSGGLDSATCLAMAKAEGYICHAISFRYGQRHAVELEAARRVAAWADAAEHLIIDIDLRQFGGSALTDDIAVPKGRSTAEMSDGIPITYVPARNTIFLSYALALAEVRGSNDIFIGVNALDYSGYPDCRPAFIESYQHTANLATRAGVEGKRPLRIHTPLMDMHKAEIITAGTALGLNYAMTVSCYDPAPDGGACGQCDSCSLRKKGFTEAGIPDPTRYASASSQP
ncbi:7-cyano-7-deazaguanine synthase QueC [Emcibacter sp. SYSU 3D8]|uniref:7-cyano-7-deazaguanine synthase QueC n=1 Tax=Emcibacter sp. SYSU 3D8 TaxID=3133969 RepID=UPI0031FF0A40